VIRISQDDVFGAAELLEMVEIVFRQRQGIHDDVAVSSNPKNTVEINIAARIELRPAVQVGTMK
jgi:hypothetical protein